MEIKQKLKKMHIRTVLWLLGVLIFVFVLGKDLYPTGILSFSSTLQQFTPFISIVTPEERTIVTERGVAIVQEPVYFDIHLPRDFEVIDLDLEYQNEDNPIVELGVDVGPGAVFAFDLQPLENQILDSLGWEVIEEKGTRLYQREKKFTSIERFKNFLPDIGTIATYNIDLPFNFSISGYEAQDGETTLSTPLIGSFSFLTYIKSEDLDFSFNFDSEEAEIRVYKESDLIYEERKNASILLKDPDNGIYRIEVSRPAGAVTSEIKTKQQKIAFIDSVWLGDSDNSVSLYTNIEQARAIAYSNAGLQKIQYDSKLINVDEPFSVVGLPRIPGVKEVEVPRGNLLLAGSGLISFSKDQFFNPRMKEITTDTDVEEEGIDFILARYTPPSVENGVKRAHARFLLPEMNINKGDLRFVLSIPKKKEFSKPIIISKLSARLEREPFSFSSFNDFFKDYAKFIYKQYVQR